MYNGCNSRLLHRPTQAVGVRSKILLPVCKIIACTLTQGAASNDSVQQTLQNSASPSNAAEAHPGSMQGRQAPAPEDVGRKR